NPAARLRPQAVARQYREWVAMLDLIRAWHVAATGEEPAGEIVSRYMYAWHEEHVGTAEIRRRIFAAGRKMPCCTNTLPFSRDAAAGEQLFGGTGRCGPCRRVGARGGSFGPSLTRSGRQRSLGYLRESIVSPDREITAGYATITVMTRDARKITGVEMGFDNF